MEATRQADPTTSRLRGWLAAVALDRRETLSWALYDWANSAFAVTVISAVLPIYYAEVAGASLPGNRATAYWGYTTSVALLLVAVLSPLLGAVADFMGAKKRFMALFATLGIVFTALLYFIQQGDWLLASSLFVVASIGFSGANVFYDSLLPHIASDKEMDQISTAGYAMGYLGGGVLLSVNVLWILSPHFFGMGSAETASRVSLFSVAIWWSVFSVPVFRNVKEPPRRVSDDDELGLNPVKAGFGRLAATLREIRRYRELQLFLVAYWLFNDGIGTIIKMAAVYGTEIGIGRNDLIGALVVTQFVGVPFAFAFGWLARRIGVKSSIYLALFVYTLISIGGFFMTQAWHFWVLALAIASVLGGSQALSRSLYGSMIPRSKSSEFFAFYSVSAKAAGILGPTLFGIIGQLAGSSRLSILSLLVFFVGGMLVFRKVDVDRGQLIARQEDARYHEAPSP